jgi:hypothetical protein
MIGAPFPISLATMRTRLRGFGLLETEQRGPALLYVFEQEGDSMLYRGGAPAPIQRAERDLLQASLITFYEQVHNDGFTWLSDCGGPHPSQRWAYLDNVSEAETLERAMKHFDPKKFLLMMDNGTRIYPGVLLLPDGKTQAQAWQDDDDEVIEADDACETLDQELAVFIEDFDEI